MAEGVENYLSQFDTPNYFLTIGRLLDVSEDKKGGYVLYHVVNRFTEMVEYQGTYLPSAIHMLRQLDESMKTIDEPLPTKNAGGTSLFN